ncbi:MAG: ribosomal protein S12 methylthiotransferase RimO [Planctomycetes bacterium RBG_19FT_COMBO_48_8]|nr:MAG: ribosomal protein S12 methylthiotransferase RimO [Planctomycetes bacterium RBG_19FT_COMBO_48_8]
MERKKQEITVGFISLGCPKNVVDSERMLAEIAQAGFLITAEADNADVIVVNTCGFIAPAEAESLEAIQHAVDRKVSGAVKKVVVAGCLSERLGPKLLEKKVEGVDAVIDLNQRDNIAKIIGKIFSSGQNGRSEDSYPAHSLSQVSDHVPDDRCRLLITPRHWAYLRISEGCNHRCSFCTIPAIRGRFRSKPIDLILAETEELVSAGAVELNVIAQDTTSYGRDLKIKNGLPALLKEFEKISGLAWLRLMYLYPTGIDSELTETITKSEKIVRYLDVPLQHVNDNILKAMRRPDTKDKLQRLIEDLRLAMPDIVLRTTLIVGFPGETDRQFEELLDFVRWARFDALGCFKFYPESGTAAVGLPGQVPDEVKQQRLDELMLTQQKITFAHNKDRIGNRLTCLVDSVDRDGLGRGRYYGQAPDIDSVCIIKRCSAQPGQFIAAKVVGTQDYDLLVKQI